MDPPTFERQLRGSSSTVRAGFHKASGPSNRPPDAIYAVESEDGEGRDGDDDRESLSAAEFNDTTNYATGKQGLWRKRKPRKRSKKINSRSKSFVSNGVEEGEQTDPMCSPAETDEAGTESSCKLPDNHTDSAVLDGTASMFPEDYEGDSHLSWRSTTNSENHAEGRYSEANSDVGNGFEHIFVVESQVL